MKNRSKYHDTYVREDEYAVYHDRDPDLPLIKIKLPSVEQFYKCSWDQAVKKIDGYGLDPKDQHFENYRKLGFYTLPTKLRDIESVVRDALQKKPKEEIYPHEIFDHIESDTLFYEDEIRWIKKQQGRMDNGVFVFIQGKPVYLNGVHYAYLMCWPVDNEHRPQDRLPFYRDVDRRVAIFYWWAYTTRSAFFKYELTYRDGAGDIHSKFYNNYAEARMWGLEKKVDFLISEVNEYVELPYRTVYGVARPKRRRDGSTRFGAFFGLVITMRRPVGRMAIQALTETNAIEDVYQEKIATPWKSMWFFFKPTHRQVQAAELSFEPTKNVLPLDVKSHGGSVVPRSSKNKAFDGLHLTFYFNDESGKKISGDVLFEWNDTGKKTLSYGPRVRGFALYTSTAGEFAKGGGEQYLRMCDQSFADERDDNGHTQTGLVVMMIPAFDGHDEFIDIYGNSVIEDTAEPYTNLEGHVKTQGAMSFLKNTRKNLERRKNWAGLNNEKRTNPFYYRELRERVNRSDNFNIDQIYEQVSDVRYAIEPRTKRYKLMWSDGLSLRRRPHNKNTTVVAVESIDGNFVISKLPGEAMQNRVIWDSRMASWIPESDVYFKHVMGIDPFRYDAEDAAGKKGLSLGAGVIKMLYDPLLDEGRIQEEWTSDRYVLTYLHRPDTTDEFAEDMLMAAVLFGAMTNVERNTGDVIKLWREWGFGGYLLYLYNPSKQRTEDVAGTYTGPEVHNSALNLLRNHLNKHIKREYHIDLLEQVLNIESVKDVTRNDLVAAAEMCEYGISRSNIVVDYTGVRGSAESMKFLQFYP